MWVWDITLQSVAFHNPQMSHYIKTNKMGRLAVHNCDIAFPLSLRPKWATTYQHQSSKYVYNHDCSCWRVHQATSQLTLTPGFGHRYMMLIHITVLSSRRVQAAIISFIPEKIIRHQISVPFQCLITVTQGHYRLCTTAVNSLDIHQHSLPHALMVQWNILWIFAKHMHGTDILMPADKWKLTLIFSWHLYFVIRKPWQSFWVVTKINKSSQEFDITWADSWCRSFISAWWLLLSVLWWSVYHAGSYPIVYTIPGISIVCSAIISHRTSEPRPGEGVS